MEESVLDISEERIAEFRADFKKVKSEISKVIVGYDAIIDEVLITILARGHAILEGVHQRRHPKVIPPRIQEPDIDIRARTRATNPNHRRIAVGEHCHTRIQLIPTLQGLTHANTRA